MYKKLHLRIYKNISNNFFIILGLFVLFPFFILSFYNNPSADDFNFYNRVNDFGFWGAQKKWYLEWGGRYSGHFTVAGIGYLICDSSVGYKLFSIFLIIMLFCSLYYFFAAVGFDFLSRKTKSIFSLMILLIYLSKMPSVVQGIFWVTSACAYQLANIFSLIFLSFLLMILRNRYKLPKSIFVAVTILLLFFAIGFTEVPMVLLILLLYLAFILNFLIYKRIDNILLVMVVCATIFSLFFILAPGNANRAQKLLELGHTNQHLFLFSLYSSIKDTIKFTSSWLIGSPILIFTLIFLPIGSRTSKYLIRNNNKLFLLHPFIVFCGFLFIMICLFFVNYWATGYGPPKRTINTTYLFFILGWFYFIQVILTFYKKKYNYSISKLPVYVWIFFIFSLVVYIISNNHNNVKIAYYDLIKGTAYKYNKEIKVRYEFLKGDCENCTIKKIKYRPKTIFNIDAQNDESHWINRGMAKFFSKKSIIISD